MTRTATGTGPHVNVQSHACYDRCKSGLRRPDKHKLKREASCLTCVNMLGLGKLAALTGRRGSRLVNSRVSLRYRKGLESTHHLRLSLCRGSRLRNCGTMQQKSSSLAWNQEQLFWLVSTSLQQQFL